jgi:aspartate-semialdehyde dehydrogenase
MSSKQLTVAVVGATGAVGTEMIRVLEARNFPTKQLRAFATSNTAGSTVLFHGQPVTVEDVAKADFKGIDVALFAGGEIASGTYAPKARDAGAVVVDNSSTFRMDPEVPLVVPEVNPEHLRRHKGIIANPNCSTIQMVVVLKPIYDKVGIEKVVVSTYQSVSGTGKAAMDELVAQAREFLELTATPVHAGATGSNGQSAPAATGSAVGSHGRKVKHKVYPHPILFNCLPQIGPFTPEGYSEEEMKMVKEPRKMFDDPNLRVSPTTVRVPVLVGHSESLNVQTRDKMTAAECRELLSKSPGVVVVDEPGQSQYPMPIDAAGQDAVYVGRIREDVSSDRGLEMWIVADNLRKGAATNAVQIAEKMLEMGLL